MSKLNKREIVEVEIESLAFGGKGVAHVNGFTIFIEHGLPGQKVKATITRKKQNYAEARVIETINHSPAEVPARCQYFGTCGGCLLQNLKYDNQLAQKRCQVIDTLEHLGGFSNLNIFPTIPSPEIFYYRNKMEYSFSNRRWLTTEEIQSRQLIDKEFALGLHISGTPEKILDIEQCYLLSERSNQIINAVREFAAKSKLQPYTIHDHTGFWRFLMIRESKHLDEMMINLITADHPNGNSIIQSLAQELRQQFPFITTIVHNINRKKAQVAFGDEEYVIFGYGYIEELLGSCKYRISANSFFQTNTLQAEKIYQLISDWGQFRKDQVIYDLYSGTGGIAIFIANQVKQVVGFELLPQSIHDASINCEINAIDNCRFIQGDLKESLKNPNELVNKFGKPSVIILDPPRSGLHPKLPDRIQQFEPERIIYVSCNPATLARDLSLLCRSDFNPIIVQPVDMFPHTAHCEVVVVLEKIYQ